MCMKDMKRKIIMVSGEEANLINAALEVERNAERRALKESQDGAVCPMIFYETETERAIIDAHQKLQLQYQIAHKLECLPLLIAGGGDSSIRPQSEELPHKYLRHAPTDMELAESLLRKVALRRQGETVFLYNNCYYERLSADKLHTLICQELRDELSISGSSRQFKSVAAAIMAEPTIEVANTRTSEATLCLENGILELRTLNLIKHSSNYFFTWKLQVSWLGEQPCPICDQFLSYAAGGDPVLIQRFWEAIGYVLAPDNQAKRFLLLQGLGDTGKSVFGSLLASFFEPQAVGSVDIFRLGDRFSLSTLANKRINISMDLSDASLNEQAVSIIKQITGRDLVQVEEKYKTPYTARVDCKLVFGTNHTVRTHSYDRAFLRRVLYLPFNYPVPKNRQNPNILNLLRAERSGILYKAVRAYQALVCRRYVFSGDDLYSFEKALQSGEQTTDQTEILEMFIQQYCTPEAGGFVTTDALFDCYTAYCRTLRQEGIRNKQVFSAKFNAAIGRFFCTTRTKKRINGIPCNGYLGLSLKEL